MDGRDYASGRYRSIGAVDRGARAVLDATHGGGGGIMCGIEVEGVEPRNGSSGFFLFSSLGLQVFGYCAGELECLVCV